MSFTTILRFFLISVSTLILFACAHPLSVVLKAKDPAFFEDRVMNVVLLDAISGKEFVKLNGPGKPTNTNSAESWVAYQNRFKTENFRLAIHSGGAEHRFEEMVVERTTELKGLPVIPVDHFVTSKGFSLGEPSSEVLRRLGSPHERNRNANGEEWVYRCESVSNCSTLARVNMPSYEARFEMDSEGRVSKIHIAYPTP